VSGSGARHRSVRAEDRPTVEETDSDLGSTLPELLVAAGLTLLALSMLGGSLLAPLAAMGRSATPDQRQEELDRAGDEVVAIVRLARPGLHDGPLLAAGPDRIEVRFGTLGHASPVVIRFHGGTLRTEHPDGTVDRVLVSGLDADRSRFIIEDLESNDVSEVTEGPTRTDAAVVTVVLVDPDASDGPAVVPGRRTERAVHLQLRLPLAARRIT
jgi:hypothetical protein